MPASRMAGSSASACSGRADIVRPVVHGGDAGAQGFGEAEPHAAIAVLRRRRAGRGGWSPGSSRARDRRCATNGRNRLVHRCQCVSTKPGMQIMPRPSMTCALGGVDPRRRRRRSRRRARARRRREIADAGVHGQHGGAADDELAARRQRRGRAGGGSRGRLLAKDRPVRRPRAQRGRPLEHRAPAMWSASCVDPRFVFLLVRSRHHSRRKPASQPKPNIRSSAPRPPIVPQPAPAQYHSQSQ